MVRITKNLKTPHDMQKFYADKGRMHGEFRVGEHVFLKVKAKKSSVRLGSYPKLAMRYYGLFEIQERIGTTAYMIALPTSKCIHNVFHVSC
jgi:hypothetical protein